MVSVRKITVNCCAIRSKRDEPPIAKLFFYFRKHLLAAIIKKSQKNTPKSISLGTLSKKSRLKKGLNMNPPHMNSAIGSHFDDFLADENILEEVSVKAQQRLLALPLADIMQAQQMTKTSLAARLHTRRSQLERILDPL